MFVWQRPSAILPGGSPWKGMRWAERGGKEGFGFGLREGEVDFGKVFERGRVWLTRRGVIFSALLGAFEHEEEDGIDCKWSSGFRG